MIKKVLLSVVILLCSFDGACNSLTFKKNAGGGYVVLGNVDANMLNFKNGSTWGRFYVSVHEVGSNYYTYTSNASYCPESAEGAADFMNARLSAGVYATIPADYSDNGKPWTAAVYCMSGPGKTWVMKTEVTSPPGSAKCTINYPAVVSFGNVTLGEVKDINHEIEISCDAFADVNVSLSKDTVTLGDAEMNYYFPGNKKSYNVAVGKDSHVNFNVRFALEKTGSTVGHKTGNALMIFSWL